MRSLGCFVLFMSAPVLLSASGGWKKVAATEQKDYWYVEQILADSSKWSVPTICTRLNLVPASGSAVGKDINANFTSKTE